MKATITAKHHSHSGQTFHVVELIKNRIVCLLIDGKKVDFGISEVRLAADKSLGREAMFSFREGAESSIRDGALELIARRAAKAWNMKISECKKAVHAYVWETE